MAITTLVFYGHTNNTRADPKINRPNITFNMLVHEYMWQLPFYYYIIAFVVYFLINMGIFGSSMVSLV